MDPAALDSLHAYDFPGNLRELLNILEHACLMSDNGVIRVEHLPERCLARPIPARQPRQILSLVEAEESYLRWAVASFPGDNRALARRLGISERTLYRRLERIRDSKVSPRECLDSLEKQNRLPRADPS